MGKNKRRSERASARFSAQWSDSDGDVKGETYTLSNHGSLVAFPIGTRIAPGAVGHLLLGLPTGKTSIEARVIWIKDEPGIVSAGVEFLNFKGEAQKNLAKVVVHLLPE